MVKGSLGSRMQRVIDAITAHILACGGRPEPKRELYGADGFGWSIYLRDPEGRRLAVSTYDFARTTG